MEDEVKDAILLGATEDIFLSRLIDLTVNSILENRPLFHDPLKEPFFYRRFFRRWVKDGLAEMAQVQSASDNANL